MRLKAVLAGAALVLAALACAGCWDEQPDRNAPPGAKDAGRSRPYPDPTQRPHEHEAYWHGR